MTWLIKLLGLPILNSLVAAYKAKLAAAGTQDAKATELAIAEIQGEIAARSAAKEIIIAEQGHWYTAIIRPLFALPFVIFIWKVVVVDKVFGLGVTDPIDPMMKDVLQAIIYSYFGLAAVDRIAKVFKR
jgi:NAD(P)H-hydrate repair Nnr-like enzyme with NAD(P)H-hydrate epimerase domain